MYTLGAKKHVHTTLFRGDQVHVRYLMQVVERFMHNRMEWIQMGEVKKRNSTSLCVQLNMTSKPISIGGR